MTSTLTLAPETGNASLAVTRLHPAPFGAALTITNGDTTATYLLERADVARLIEHLTAVSV